jgi:hypothetical protein
MFKMRKLIFAALLTAAPVLALNSTPAAACWGFGYGYSASYAPRTYSYAPRAYSYGYAPASGYYGSRAYYGRSVYRRGVVRRAAWRAGRRW